MHIPLKTQQTSSVVAAELAKIILPTALQKSINTFIDAQAQRCASHQEKEELQKTILRDFEWLRSFADIHYRSRFARATDLSKPEIKEVQDLARAYIGLGSHDFFATCVDGRNMPVVMFSEPPRVGGVLRAPAGAVTGFMEGQKPKTAYIDHESYVVQRLMHLFKEKAGDTIYYGLDSHLACAARGQIHATEGGLQSDGGLRSDILSKVTTARGILQLNAELADTGVAVAQVIPTFFSYDPHTGGVVAGLELHLEDDRVAKTGYTEEVLEALAAEGKIIRTLDILQQPESAAEISAHIGASSADFRMRYAESLVSNWRAVTALFNGGKGALFQRIVRQLHTIYVEAGWSVADLDSFDAKAISEKTIKQKAKFLLKNCVTRYSIAGANHTWPFDTHQEEMIVITDGGYAPFMAINAFAVFSRDVTALLSNTKLTIDLIRSFRRAATISNPVTSVALSPEDFISAPVFISNKAIVKDISPESWEVFQSLPLADVLLKLDWDSPQVLAWRRSDILKLIQQVAQKTSAKVAIYDIIVFVDALYELFDRMRVMMKDKYFRKMVLHGDIVVFNTLVDANRMPMLVVPMVV